jgi:hypothetical protein
MGRPTKAAQSVPTKETQVEPKNFVPVVEIAVEKLPSKGIAYPKGTQVQYRPFLFGEVKQLSGSKLSVKESYMHILKGVEASIDPMDLTLADVMYLGLLRKISTLGSTEIVARYTCEKCRKPSRIVFKTDEVEFDDIKAPGLPMEVDFSFGTVKFSPLTLRQFLDLYEAGKSEDDTALFAAQALEGDFEDLYKKFFNAGPSDSAMLMDVDQYLYHGLKPLTRPCPTLVDDPQGGGQKRCGNRVEIELDGGQALLMPFRPDRGTQQNRIRFGVAGKR